jgi:hypothetical protein
MRQTNTFHEGNAGYWISKQMLHIVSTHEKILDSKGGSEAKF